MVYLRARYYAPVTGTFLSRDTWEGDANLPMSYNKWLYTNGNPVNYTDPSGMKPTSFAGGILDLLSFFGTIPDYKGLAIVHIYKSIFDESETAILARGLHKTTIAASIAVQSQWMDYPVDTIKNLAYMMHLSGCDNPLIDKILSKSGVGYAKSSELSKYGNLLDMKNSIKAMTEKVYNVTNACKWSGYQCSEFDKLIVAAMAQNTGFTKIDIRGLVETSYNKGQIKNDQLFIDWTEYFSNIKTLSETHPADIYARFNDFRAIGRKNYNTRFMLHLFTQDMFVLNTYLRWELPQSINTNDLNEMMSIALFNKDNRRVTK